MRIWGDIRCRKGIFDLRFSTDDWESKAKNPPWLILQRNFNEFILLDSSFRPLTSFRNVWVWCGMVASRCLCLRHRGCRCWELRGGGWGRRLAFWSSGVGGGFSRLSRRSSTLPPTGWRPCVGFGPSWRNCWRRGLKPPDHPDCHAALKGRSSTLLLRLIARSEW